LQARANAQRRRYGKRMFPFIRQFKHLRSFLFLYLVICGLAFYLLGVFIESVFIYKLKMSPGWCVEPTAVEGEYGYHEECIRFKNKIEELKYNHNQTMQKRISIKLYVMFALASIVTLLLMLLAPSHFFDNGNEFIHRKVEVIFSGMFYGFLISIVIPLICIEVFPPPIEWLPNEIISIRQARAEFALQEIIKLSK